MEITRENSIAVNSFLVGALTILVVISVYLSYQANRLQAAHDEQVAELRTDVAKITKFIDDNEFVKQP